MLSEVAILRAALKEIAAGATNCMFVNRDGLATFARAALEAAAKAPGQTCWECESDLSGRSAVCLSCFGETE